MKMLEEATTSAAAAANETQNSNALENAVTIASSTNNISSTPVTKEKRSWFHSLTRRKKSQSQTSLAPIEHSSSTNTPTTESSSPPIPVNLQNNNNEPLQLLVGTEEIPGTSRKRKDEKNVFQRFRKKMGLHLLRRRRNVTCDDDGAGGTTDASAEFLTHSPIRELQLTFSFSSSGALEEPEMIPFTNDYKRFIVKKWLECDSGPNRIMYKASSEMLSQVWYWGEISRRDAQRQLTDKPTGSFLVRDSETSGSQFTLSFRILNVTLHYRLEYRDNYWHFEELEYESIVEMIEDILYRCTNDNFVCFVKVPNEMQPPFPVILKYPLSRYFKMPLLQDLCRRVIQRHATSDEMAKLPIPPKLHEYLSEKRELVFQC